MQKKKSVIFLAIMFMLVSAVFSADDAEDDGGFGFNFALGIGTQTFNEESGSVTYQTVNLKPELTLGDFGLGLDLTFNFIIADENGDFVFRTADWVPVGDTDSEKFSSFLELYLPIFQYIRYGHKNDPFYFKFGSIEDGTLGNGFIMGNYDNTLFMPEKRIIGLSLDVDGNLFNFPYVGIETFAGNLALFDVIGARLYARPLAFLEIPVIKDIELGVTWAADLDPEANYEFSTYTGAIEPVQMVGIDIFDPIVNIDGIFSLAAFGDIVIQPIQDTAAAGGMLGIGGKIISLFTYGLQIRFLGQDFIPVYFDSSYDLYREEKYLVSNGIVHIDPYTGWLASLGLSILDDILVFYATIDSPFVISDEADVIGHPHLYIRLAVKEELIPNITFAASLDKKNLDQVDSWSGFWTDTMVIGAEINYDTGPAVLTLSYDLRYNPEAVPPDSPWETTARLTSTFNLF